MMMMTPQDPMAMATATGSESPTSPGLSVNERHTQEESISSDQSVETDKFVHSMPYVKSRDAVETLFGLERRSQSARRISTASSVETATTSSSPENDEPLPRMMPTSLSYSVPTMSTVTNTPRGRPHVDVIATYMNTSDSRSVKADLLRSHAHFSSPHNSLSRIRSSSMMSKEGSADWGWFADIDSSSESWGGDGSLTHLRRKMSADLGLVDYGNSVHVLGDEQTNTRITAAHKTFNIVTDGKSKVVSATISIPKFRIVQSRAGSDRHAQYLITLKLGKELYADWRRYSEFGELSKKLDLDRYKRSHEAWRNIDTRWFNRLEPSYLHQKCITLENFMRELMYESNEPSVLIDFLGGYLAKVNSRPSDPAAYRPAAQLPKELRPPQPKHERELFEKMWEENFKRSRVDYSAVPTN
ncbi:hypothetical protein Poli38472_002878 [Pythium oligandrum]|uniref:PX domain-containing protein n=1 Tax=Pythium oligandrum TaxID=41045 RepID=A0A8K1FFM1_PYTOL|nr:hypothetical protein Poli38472_002878 [Pythium oligandrum]|eukprot:TMW56953.1 hypothetical protein Poli38472_002878 [Pythium oligandrum]